MILVLVGTSDYNFKRVLNKISELVDNGTIKDKVIMQAGCNHITSNKMEVFDLIEKDKLDKLVSEASLIITHGGVGSIISALEKKKKVIAIARLKKYAEVANDHQKQIIDEFVKRGYILTADEKNLADVIESAKTFKPKEYKSNNKNFVKVISDYIDSDNHTGWYNKYRNILSNGFPGIILSILNILIYNMLNYNYIFNVVISFIVTLVISLIINLFIDVKINKRYILGKSIHFFLDILLMYILNPFKYSKICTNIIICIILFIYSKRP